MNRSKFESFLTKKGTVLVLDGGMGTLLAERGWTPPSLPEEMNLDSPGVLTDIHSAYRKAGADIIETNSFGGSPVKLALRGLASRAREINQRAAELAKTAAGENVLVAGSVGPLGELLSPFGSLSFEEAYRAFRVQVQGLLEGGADFILIETMMDLREAKAAVLAVKDEDPDGAFVVSFTFDQKGRTVTGTPPDVAARWAAAMGASGVGANCGLGPEAYVPAVRELAAHGGIPVFVYANGGLPGTDGYISPEEFASWGPRLAEAGASVIGGCCGTTPAHIRALAGAIAGIPRRRSTSAPGTPLASRSRLILAGPGHPFRVIGERINVSRKSPLREEISRLEWTTLRQEARLQTAAGAHVLDVNVGLPAIDQESAMASAVEAAEQSSGLPISIDSDGLSVLRSGLSAVTGIPLINSFTARENSLFPGLALAARHGAAAVVLPMDEDGLPETPAGRKAVIKKILSAADSCGFPREGLVIDGLTLAVGADSSAPAATLETISFLRDEGITSVLGLSNISHGMPSRPLLNRTFLAMAVAAGLSSAILNPLDGDMMETVAASEVLAGRDPGGARFISASPGFSSSRGDRQKGYAPPAADTEASLPEGPFLSIGLAILHGDAATAETAALESFNSGILPLDLVNRGVIPALEEVGRRYDRGTFFLPQLISSAEAAQRVCGMAMERMDPSVEGSRGRILLATVEGDLHDLGKNVVATILKSHGYAVTDLGKNVSCDAVVREVSSGAYDVVGLSALMTSTMKNMALTAREIRRRMPDIFVIVGGASVTDEFARSIGAHGYAPDAVSSVRLVESLMASRKSGSEGGNHHADP